MYRQHDIAQDDAVDRRRHLTVNAAKGKSSMHSLEPFSWRTNIRAVTLFTKFQISLGITPDNGLVTAPRGIDAARAVSGTLLSPR